MCSTILPGVRECCLSTSIQNTDRSTGLPTPVSIETWWALGKSIGRNAAKGWEWPSLAHANARSTQCVVRPTPSKCACRTAVRAMRRTIYCFSRRTTVKPAWVRRKMTGTNTPQWVSPSLQTTTNWKTSAGNKCECIRESLNTDWFYCCIDWLPCIGNIEWFPSAQNTWCQWRHTHSWCAHKCSTPKQFPSTQWREKFVQKSTCFLYVLYFLYFEGSYISWNTIYSRIKL